jgi:hypothetical protein
MVLLSMKLGASFSPLGEFVTNNEEPVLLQDGTGGRVTKL